MTLSSETNRVQYDGTGSQISFAVSFVFWDNDDLLVTHRDSSGTETTWTRGTQFTLTGGNGSTGTLTVITSPTDNTPASGETLTIESDLDNVQDLSLPAGGAVPTAPLEQRLDKNVRLTQQLVETIARAVKLSVTSAESEVTLEDLSGSTGLFVRVNAAEDGLEFVSISSSGTLGIPVGISDGGTGGTTEATARSSLNLPTAAQQARHETAANLALYYHAQIGA